VAESLAKQVFDVGFAIDHKDVGAQFPSPPGSACAGMIRGNVIMNSVNEPGSVTNSIVPPCCFTTMSWLKDSPSTVPSPAGFVVKNGLKIFSWMSVGIPVPLSRMRTSTLSPRFDRIVSVGMFEHVGPHQYQTFFKTISCLLTNEGVALVHSIGRMRGPDLTGAWIRKYIFPGGYILLFRR